MLHGIVDLEVAEMLQTRSMRLSRLVIFVPVVEIKKICISIILIDRVEDERWAGLGEYVG
jgi:hypothetical protein